jgi:hypothetical protein
MGPTGERTFYELAATLIPILLFGGIVAGSLRPPRNPRNQQRPTDRDYAFAGVIFVGLVWLIFAEGIAISQASEPSDSEFARWAVVIALLLGLVAVGVAIMVPWVRLLRGDGVVFRRRGSALVLLCAAGLVFSVVLSTGISLRGALESAERSEIASRLENEARDRGTTANRELFDAMIAAVHAKIEYQADGQFTRQEKRALKLRHKKVGFERVAATQNLEAVSEILRE